jgi:septum formation protein
MGLTFESESPTFAEDLDKSLFPTAKDYVMENSYIKAMEIWRNNVPRQGARIGLPSPDIIIGCDTVVVQDGAILEKPRDHDHAYLMLKALSGREHRVYSGVTILSKQGRGTADRTDAPQVLKFVEETSVVFDSLDDDTIHTYIETKEPFDKAGGYGIQGVGGDFVTGIRGCYYNVMGLPRSKLAKHLKSIMETMEH